MSDSIPTTDDISPKDPRKTYALVEVVPGESPMVGKGPDDTVFSFPIVLLWEFLLLLGTTLAIFVFSIIKQAPLEEIANPLITTDPAKAPWYFLGLQELLEHMHPTLAGVIIPGILVLFLLALPYIDHSRENVGKWFSSRRGKRITLLTALYTLILMTSFIGLDNYFTIREMLREVVPQWVSQGLIPFGIILFIVALPIIILKIRRANTHELMLALFTIMFVSAIVLTISGFLFRGPGFKLYLPWEMPSGYNPWDGL
jgi:quinol-cytochrome oxidoreductase complex cytochrome b subunit